MNIQRENLFGTQITVIGTVHSMTGTGKEEMETKLSSIRPDIILIEYPENGIPNKSVRDIDFGDIKGALSYCDSTGTEYKPIDKLVKNHISTLKSELDGQKRRELQESESGDKSREIIFNNTVEFSRQVSEREQNMIKNIISLSGSYSSICIIVGSTHVKPLVNQIQMMQFN